jgi:hypothetical protein
MSTKDREQMHPNLPNTDENGCLNVSTTDKRIDASTSSQQTENRCLHISTTDKRKQIPPHLHNSKKKQMPPHLHNGQITDAFTFL